METTKNKTDNRNYGLDLLRLLIGFMVVLGHAIGRGGILDHAPEGSLNFKIVWFIEAWAYSCPDIFIIISGYTSISERDKKQDWSKLIVLWLQVLFYSVVFTIIYTLINGAPLEFPLVLRSFFPLMNHPEYWFFASYCALFILKPFIDKGIKAFDEKELKILFCIIFAVFSLYTVIGDPFYLISGITPFWFILLYILGAITKKCALGERISSAGLLAMVYGLIIITWLSKNYCPAFYIMGHRIDENTLYSYTSPTITGCAILRVILYSRLKPGKFTRSVVRFAAPSVFAIYLLNTHPVYWNSILPNQFIELAPRRLSVMLPPVFLYSVSFYAAALLIDKIRQMIFKSLRVQARIHNLLYAGDKNMP